jgi:hypothetical protein
MPLRTVWPSLARWWVALAVAAPGVAAAEPGLVTIGGEAGQCRPPAGESAWFGGGSASLGLDDTWSLALSAFQVRHAAGSTQEADSLVTGLAAGVETALDVSPVRPFLELLAGALVERAYERTVRPQVEIAAGVDWHFSRYASTGFAGRWSLRLRGDEAYFRLGPRLSLTWP